MFKLIFKSIANIFTLILLIISVPNIFMAKSLFSKDLTENDNDLLVQENSNKHLTKYILGAGDSVFVRVFMAPEISGIYSIGPDGYIYLTEIEGFNATGYTLPQLQKIIKDKYSQIVKNPKVNVRIVSYRPIRVLVSGEVERPGFYTLTGTTNQKSSPYSLPSYEYQSYFENVLPLEDQLINDNASVLRDTLFPTVFDAIRASQGITINSDLENIIVIRKASKEDGSEEFKTTLNFLSLLNEGDISQNIRIFDGDRIIIKKTSFNIPEQILKAKGSNISPDFTTVYVSGEVKNPGRIVIPQGSSLNQAIALAGGKEFLSGRIEFLRFKSDGSVVKRNFSMDKESKINSYKNPSLKTGDIINIRNSSFNLVSEAVTQLTRPFVGIFSVYNLFD